MVEIRAATPDELPEVLAVLDDAAAWLQSIGVTEQWPVSFSADPAWAERFGRWAAAGNVFLARGAEGTALGCFRLVRQDETIWQDVSGRHIYLHSLAVLRGAAGRGVADAMLAWAREYAASLGAEELRLDCYGGNERLVRYYADAGFEPRGRQLVERNQVWTHLASDSYYVAKFALKV